MNCESRAGALVLEAARRGTVSNLRMQQEVVPRDAAYEGMKQHRVTACQSTGDSRARDSRASGINIVQIAPEKIPRTAQYPRVHSELELNSYVGKVPDWLKDREKFKLLI
ncbi:hypothetical protein B0H13DRAFT_1893900 [Mycena leptocephala]|nr:hypothetical protein B0H13DRAFT_1893900 [Mycena leptocephala]